ncbi:MAG: cytochrome B [Sulfitobacter sp.]|nr:cytochrome B [Sulfitobacter sp.]
MLATIRSRLPRRRTFLKVMHWAMVPLLVWFVLVTPDDVLPFGPKAFQAHSILALIFVTICLVWWADYFRRGLASRPGPKLPKWAWHLHLWMHRALVWGLFLVAVGGFLLGLTSTRLLKAGGFLPIAPPLGLREANEVIGKLHIYQFYLLAALVVGHALFHLWRHYRLRDNALRIMVPKRLHRFL